MIYLIKYHTDGIQILSFFQIKQLTMLQNLIYKLFYLLNAKYKNYKLNLIFLISTKHFFGTPVNSSDNAIEKCTKTIQL